MYESKFNIPRKITITRIIYIELEKKIEYFIENFSNNNENDNSSLITKTNKHDIILFVLFGIFVLLVFESISNLTLKVNKS